ncbi:MAG: phosphate transport system regulatory protein PhoU [Candidatus Altiarchaeales archaeon A3]|nr:MAG: phosphate transport system regulatory protein PhoU [Candidatus Altiarchaeales archaeon A3]
MARSALDREISRIKRDLGSMSELVQKALNDAMVALRTRDLELSQKVIDLDNEEIDVLYKEIEERCIQCIALHQPVAGDLRFISTVINVAVDVERIGDYAKDIARIVPFIVDEKPSDAEKILQEMGGIVKIMVRDSIDSFINKDKEMFPHVVSDEEKVDALYGSIFPKLKETAESKNCNISLSLNLLLVGRCLERSGDHAINVSRRAMYVIRGVWEYL